MCNHQTTSRADTVGSFLRPERLKEAREQFAQGTISRQELSAVEDEEILKLIDKQKEAGLTVVSDGEFRRSYWHLDFFWGFEGVEHVNMGQGYLFHGEETRDDSARLSGKIRFTAEHPFLAHFRFLKENAGEGIEARQSIPAPAQLYAELVRGVNEEKVNEIYPDRKVLFADISHAYREAILAFYELGCRDLKLDDCTWGMLCDKNFWATMAGANYNVEDLKETYLKLNNDALKDLPADLKLSTHVCRGNYHSTWASSGGYEPVAEVLFGKENVDSFFLEFDDERSGGFEPLRFVSGNKKVVLGLITSKHPELEAKEQIKARIREASQFVPLDRLYLSPQCGFASTEEGNKLTEQQQWDKVRLISDIAAEVWSDRKEGCS
ncbi:MAG TPA: 5-methyltetrahydropteroyltriglutamate--homocysteine methyltransferase [Porphyromonadaceae bacterium]|jgi:5-methyltetrahydropteroyltriglutamate--homocysteine methyltransferase|nr:5-methyltetrahydropteroyltriglutamate--homocysteine methyltransferase [Porphyromonadaceae bacterium]HBL33236.1 5-methyltetrahydropteroyltriglutamate--homocysteine methyltransferase [Porphyromonadaceae bacterium]HBX21510.1 5-methyltetrahydropteroyltriglutamate--homocysteine methyltransferase [Porphyromonadaceae bacterium]HCM21692.1 5-methyltetrahydropteroyltriglutamate--homocysteine methyltransferase [Porphyromonadaceae bacterium]